MINILFKQFTFKDVLNFISVHLITFTNGIAVTLIGTKKGDK